MKRVPIISSHEVDTGNEDESVVDIYSYLEMQSDAQLAADKSHCSECMARQEAETKKMSDLYFETRVLLGKKIGEVEQLKSEHVQAYKDWEGATMKAEKLIKEHYEAEIASLKSQLAEKGK